MLYLFVEEEFQAGSYVLILQDADEHGNEFVLGRSIDKIYINAKGQTLFELIRKAGNAIQYFPAQKRMNKNKNKNLFHVHVSDDITGRD